MLKLLCMSKNIKQVYVALQMYENEIDILIGEYFNTRFNIIRADKYPSNAISDFMINNREELIKDIRKAIKTSAEKIGTEIEQLLLIIPAYNFKRFPLRSKVYIDSGVIRKEDIARAVSNSLRTKVDEDVMVVNPMIVKYIVNGISTRRMPEREICDEAIVDIDLLCADLNICYEYVSIIEEAGFKVLDICLNTYAIAREAALFEESLTRNVIILDVNRSCTYLSLLSKGKLVSTEVIFDGLNSLINRIYRTYNVPYNDIGRLVKYAVNYESEYPDDIVYAWSDSGNTRTITTRELNDEVAKPLNTLCDKLITMCSPIIDENVKIVLTGEGEEMSALRDLLSKKSGVRVKGYYPDTIGVRDPSLTALYGAFFVYRDKVLLNDINVSCIDLLRYDALIDHKELDSEGETITTKIKNLFKQYLEKGGN